MTALHHQPDRRRGYRGVFGVLIGLSMLAAACSSDGADSIALEPGAGPARITLPGGETIAIAATGQLDGADPFTFEYSTFDGELTTLAAVGNGKPVVLNFFASTCVACIREMPDFEEVANELAADVQFVGLATDGDRPEDAFARVLETGVTYPVGMDPDGQYFVHYEAFGMPTTVFLHPDGTVAQSWTGALDSGSLKNKIQELLL
ncbi:MAG: TlpA family protein disulfide reductase [Acidimicrobiales bacterium]|nr:TlpA family protein disulfide reductase [Acidimicrobiales bacterium]